MRPRLLISFAFALSLLIISACSDDKLLPTPLATLKTSTATPAPSQAPQPTATPTIPAPTVKPSPALATVRFMAGFRPQADLPFVAAYVAKEKGFFAEQGLNVEISHAFQSEHLRLLLANEIDVTTANADSVIRNRAATQAPIKAIALFGQQSEQAYAVLKDSGINSPKDFEGKTVGYRTAATPDYLAMLKLTGTDRSKIKEVPVTFDPRLLTEKKVDVYPVFLSNEPFTLKQIGFEVKTFSGADYGVPTLGLTYIVKEDSLAAKLEVYQRFLKAAMKGLYYARNNIDEAVDITLTYAKDASREQQKFLMLSEMDRAVTQETLKNGLGWMTEAQWMSLHDSLLQYNAIAAQVPTALLYDDSFLKSIYKDGKLIWP